MYVSNDKVHLSQFIGVFLARAISKQFLSVPTDQPVLLHSYNILGAHLQKFGHLSQKLSEISKITKLKFQLVYKNCHNSHNFENTGLIFCRYICLYQRKNHILGTRSQQYFLDYRLFRRPRKEKVGGSLTLSGLVTSHQSWAGGGQICPPLNYGYRRMFHYFLLARDFSLDVKGQNIKAQLLEKLQFFAKFEKNKKNWYLETRLFVEKKCRQN